MHRFLLTRHLQTLVIAVCLATAAFATTAHAADNGNWSVEPGGQDSGGARSAFLYTLKPGQVFQDVVSVSNVSDEPLTFDVYATDAYNTAVDAAFALLDEDVEPSDAGAWVTLSTQRITIEANTRADIPFQVTVPEDASPGDHIAGIIASADIADPEVNEDGATMIVRRRVAARMYIRVDGPLQADLQITRLDVEHQSALFPPFTGTGRAVITYEIRNSGNVRIAPEADLVVTGWAGRTIHRFETESIPELLPRSSVLVVETFDGLPPLERLSAELSVTGSPGPGQESIVTTGSNTFWVVSWLLVALVLAGLFASAMYVRRRRRRRRRRTDAQPPTPTKEPVAV